MTDPVPMLLWCPECKARHVDVGEFATKVHHTHACQSCGHVWRPAIVPTVGVQFLPGFKDVAPRKESWHDEETCPGCGQVRGSSVHICGGRGGKA